MTELFISGIAMAAGGMPDWTIASEVLSGRKPWNAEPLDRYKPELLPPNEKRRATDQIRLAFRVCEEILRAHPDAVREALTVFASSGGDYRIIDQICRMLCESERALSPTQFHNSVHNAAAGYWSIAAHSTQPSTSLSCHDFSFAAGLLEAAAMAADANKPVLLAVFDADIPQPILSKRNIAFPFAVALLLSTTKNSPGSASIALQQCKITQATQCNDQRFEVLRSGNPAARALPLLELLARKQPGSVELALPGTLALRLDVKFDSE